MSRTQVETLRRNCAEFGVPLHPMGDAEQGIVHVVGPQLGLTQPGMTVVCGDSHTSTHGAFGAMAFGIGTSEVEHVLATQTLPLQAVQDHGDQRRRTASCARASRAKDIILAVIAKIGTGGGQGYVLEYRGSAIETLSMEGRMTICNMSIEAGARAGMVAPDETTFDYLQGRAARAEGRGLGRRGRGLAQAAHRRRRACSTPRSYIDADDAEPVRHLGHQPGPGRAAGRARCPTPRRSSTRTSASPPSSALEYMGLEAGTPLRDIAVDAVFVGSCTNGRIEDLRVVADDHARAARSPTACGCWSCPARCGCASRPRHEGLDKIFTDAGAEWRSAGCSMCLGMNPDQLAPGRALRVDVEPQLRGPPGQGRPHPPGLPAGRRRDRGARHPVARPQISTTWT